MHYGTFFTMPFSTYLLNWIIGQINKVKNMPWEDMDEKTFFREATLRICGSLEIDNSLWQLLLYLQKFMPAEAIFLNVYFPELGIIETIAKADHQGGGKISIKTLVPPDSRKIFAEMLSGKEPGPYLYKVEHMSENEITELFSQTIGMPDAAALVMRPKLEGKLLGGVVVINNLGEKYSPGHLRLLALLNEPFAIALSNYLRYREILRLKDILADDNRYLQRELNAQVGEEIVGANFGLKGVMELVRQVAPLSSPVLLLGETGVGKEVIANAIHRLSPRRENQFIKVNCGAIPETLIDSELFGHEKGAFTGALSQKRGRFERAHGGTIFLDEIGDLPREVQARLLRVLQEKEIERVGGTEPIKVDIRIIAATNRHLEKMVALGQFREDLYFRLNVFPIEIPPLRERKADIPALVQHFMLKKAREMGLTQIPTLAPSAIDRLLNYHWPGNVRELQNAVERALILSQGKPLTFEDLTPSFIGGQKSAPYTHQLGDVPLSLNQVITNHIVQVLKMTNGRVGGNNGAAQLLEINPSTLRKKMKKLGIPFGRKTHKSLL